MEIQDYCGNSVAQWQGDADYLVGKYPTSKIDIGLGDYPDNGCTYSSATIAGQVLQYLISSGITRISTWPPGGGASPLSPPPDTNAGYSDTVYGTTSYYGLYNYFLSHGGKQTIPYFDDSFSSNINYYGALNPQVVTGVAMMAYDISSTGVLTQYNADFYPTIHPALAHSYGFKVVVLCNCGCADVPVGEVCSPSTSSELAGMQVLLNDTTFTGAAKTFGDDLLKQMNLYGYDEWQMDWEFEYWNTSSGQQAVANLLNYLATRINPKTVTLGLTETGLGTDIVNVSSNASPIIFDVQPGTTTNHSFTVTNTCACHNPLSITQLTNFLSSGYPDLTSWVVSGIPSSVFLYGQSVTVTLAVQASSSLVIGSTYQLTGTLVFSDSTRQPLNIAVNIT